MARRLALAVALAAALLPVSGAGGTDLQTPKRGGRVVVGAIEPPCLNVLVSPCKDFVLPISTVLYGAFDAGPDYARRPRLVSRVDFTRRPPFTLTYHIRPEARWSDGVLLTARDFVFTYRARLRYPALPDDDPYKSRIRSVRAVDSKTFRVVLRSRFAFWRGLFDVVLPAHALRGVNLATVWRDRIDNPKTGSPIGSGPHLVQRWDRGKELTLVRNPRYWGPHLAYLDRIVLRFVAPLGVPESVDRFRNGEIDVAQWQFTSPDVISELRRVRSVRLLFPPDAPGWEHLDIRVGAGGHPALRSKLVRQAIALGIDRVAIVQALFGEFDASARPLDSAVFRSSHRFYRPNWSSYRYRPGLARQRLERAGCRRGEDGIYACGGTRLTLRFVSRGGSPRRVQTLELIQRQLGQVGVVVEPVYAASHDQVLVNGAFDVTLFAWFGPGAEGGGIDSLYGCGGDLNYMGYCQRLVTRDLDQSDRILDRKRWADVLNRADAQLARDVPVIPLFEVPAVAAVRSSVRGYVPNFLDPTWNAEDWWLDD